MWTWREIEQALGKPAAAVQCVNAVLSDAGRPTIKVGTWYVWKHRGLSRSLLWAVADALRRAGANVQAGDLIALCAKEQPQQESGRTGLNNSLNSLEASAA